MPSARAEHRNAILKIVKERRLILQHELAKSLNKDSINTPSKQLAEQGKLKRVKIKVRGKVGNLIDQWLLHSNDVKYDEVLDFEQGQINKPYESPLVINHCYARKNPPRNRNEGGKIGRPRKVLESNIEIVETKELLEVSNVIDIKQYINVNNVNVPIMEFNNQRVITFKEIDQTHQRPDGTARRTFNKHKDKFVERKHYFVCNTSEAEEMGIIAPNGLKLITESGYLLLVKPFEDELSWKVQDMLVDSYFKMKEIKDKVENNLPIVKQDFTQFNLLEVMFNCIKTNHQEIEVLKNQTETQAREIQELQEFKNKFKSIAQ